jgi:hypothetical protein
MTPLEKLFRLEIEFHRRLRALPPGVVEAGSLHTSYALQTGYESLLHSLGAVSAMDIESLRERFACVVDPRDACAAGETLGQLLGIPAPHD